LNEDEVIVSVIMPVYNEEKYIADCIESLLKQDYSIKKMEWLFIDGCSTDNTVAIIEQYKSRYPYLITYYSNPKRIVPYAMNIGIRHARGKYIIRLDAHAEYAKDYISKSIFYLETTDADNVGGVAETRSRGKIGETIARMLSSKFGVGNSQFRTGGVSGYVDTVPFGAFRREVFEKWGGFDERLTRNQDNEINYRIRKNGGKVYLASDIHFSYYCRDSIKGIVNMSFKNGMWNVITMKLCPGSMGIRHFIPLIFVLSLICLPFLCWLWHPVIVLFVAELSLYFLMNIFFSLKQAESLYQFNLLFILFPIFHITYGLGSIAGICKVILKKF
jgi:glycosyltransferase involved in cell wall biosynthesis